MTLIETPVLIVGGGPIGLLGAKLLARRGVASLVAEKHPTRLEAPKAHALNPRSLEICAQAGLSMSRLHELATPRSEGSYVRMTPSLADEGFGRLPYERQDEAMRALTPWPLINIEQPRFEEVIEYGLRDESLVCVRRGLEWRSCLQVADGVISSLIDRSTGEEVRVRSRRLIGADGAASAVREAIGVPMDGPEALAHNMMIHFEADLRSIVADRPAILYFLFGPHSNGVFIAYDIGKTWVLMHPCRADDPVEAFDEDRCRQAVMQAIGAPVPDLVIKGARRWAMSAQTARRYQDGRIFLAGDAAHRFPPTGGLGLNTGVADIDNLTWKVAAVERGWASTDLLETYERERRPVAQVNLGQSLGNAMRMRALTAALGYAPSGTVDAETFATRLTVPEMRAKVDQAVAHQTEHFDSLRLQLGYAYGDALQKEDSLPINAFNPALVSGARLPHRWLDDGRSILDLVDVSGFTIFTGVGGDGWRALEARLDAPSTVLCEGVDFRFAQGVESAGGAAAWTNGLGSDPTAAVVVRPDGHVLHAARSGGPSALQECVGVINATLGVA